MIKPSPDKLSMLRALMKEHKLDAYLIPTNDEYLGEYAAENKKRLAYLTGFTGSNGTALITQNDAILFTDGRYILQAKKQLPEGFKVINLEDSSLAKFVISSFAKNSTLGFDPFLHSVSFIMNLQRSLRDHSIKAQPCAQNLVDAIWKDCPKEALDPIYIHHLQYSGLGFDKKLEIICNALNENKLDCFLLTTPESICWLLNLRARDVQYTPILQCYFLIYKDGHGKLIVDPNRITDEISQYLGDKIKIKPMDKLEKIFAKIAQEKLILGMDYKTTPFGFFAKGLEADIDIKGVLDPTMHPKSIKNQIEIAGARRAHIADGIAVSKFLCWLEQNAKTGNLTELDIEDKLLELRSQQNEFVFPSFATIAGFAANGAIIHYKATTETNQNIKLGKGQILLVDSGGQYCGGTTDITRTIAIGDPTNEQKQAFTLVLKGHINLARAKFPFGVTGSDLDPIARYHLWQHHMDYAHGTGHGVGSFLSVHEGPQRIGRAHNEVPLTPGMIISNEPGFYKEGEFGIRIESLVLVCQLQPGYLGFETLTQVPIDLNLVEEYLLAPEEKAWLNSYHEAVYSKLLPFMETDTEKDWLKKATRLLKISG